VFSGFCAIAIIISCAYIDIGSRILGRILVSNESRQAGIVAARNSEPPQDARPARPRYLIVALAVGFVHFLLFLHDIADGAGFFRADRAAQRFHAIRNLLASSDD